jgi:hypothetical protein
MPTFLKSDLLIPQDRITQITDALKNDTVPDPMTVVITEQKRKVDNLTAKYTIDDDWYRSLVRPLVMYHLYASGSIGAMPKEVAEAYEKVNAELAAINKGEHPGLAQDDPLPSEARPSTAGWGSNTKLKLPSDDS